MKLRAEGRVDIVREGRHTGARGEVPQIPSLVVVPQAPDASFGRKDQRPPYRGSRRLDRVAGQLATGLHLPDDDTFRIAHRPRVVGRLRLAEEKETGQLLAVRRE